MYMLPHLLVRPHYNSSAVPGALYIAHRSGLLLLADVQVVAANVHNMVWRLPAPELRWGLETLWGRM